MRCCGCRIVSVVAVHHIGQTQKHLADLTRWQCVAVLIGDPRLALRQWAADAACADKRVVIFERDNEIAARLGHPEGLTPGCSPAVFKGLVQPRWDRRAHDHADLVRALARIGGHFHQHRGHGAEAVAPGPVERPPLGPDARRVEPVERHQPAAGEECAGDIPLRVHVIKGLGGQHHLLGANGECVHQLTRHRQPVCVGQHATLWLARGA